MENSTGWEWIFAEISNDLLREKRSNSWIRRRMILHFRVEKNKFTIEWGRGERSQFPSRDLMGLRNCSRNRSFISNSGHSSLVARVMRSNPCTGADAGCRSEESDSAVVLVT
ncbi:hypothetical protein TNCV_2654621 [Trichonephila clavipes]|nr:hypothetical protein TNCV_2654621 [Trichonephila clavipes]